MSSYAASTTFKNTRAYPLGTISALVEMETEGRRKLDALDTAIVANHLPFLTSLLLGLSSGVSCAIAGAMLNFNHLVSVGVAVILSSVLTYVITLAYQHLFPMLPYSFIATLARYMVFLPKIATGSFSPALIHANGAIGAISVFALRSKHLSAPALDTYKILSIEWLGTHRSLLAASRDLSESTQSLNNYTAKKEPRNKKEYSNE